MFVLVCNHSKAKRGQKLNYPNGGVDIFFTCIDQVRVVWAPI